MCACGGIEIVIGVPEQTATISGTIPGRMVNIDVRDMACQGVGQIEPTCIAAAQVLQQGAKEEVVLIVVVRHQRQIATVISKLMICVDLAVIAPAVFVNDLAPGREALIPLNHFAK